MLSRVAVPPAHCGMVQCLPCSSLVPPLHLFIFNLYMLSLLGVFCCRRHRRICGRRHCRQRRHARSRHRRPTHLCHCRYCCLCVCRRPIVSLLRPPCLLSWLSPSRAVLLSSLASPCLSLSSSTHCWVVVCRQRHFRRCRATTTTTATVRAMHNIPTELLQGAFALLF